MPKISVIVVGHKAYEKYLPTAIKSLQSQTIDCEVIYVENTGNTLGYGSNRGIEQSTGEYIVRVDADDWVEPELLEYESQYLDTHPEIDCVYSDFIEAREVRENVFTLEITEQRDLTHACAAMYRRSVWEGLGGYDENLKYQESVDYWHRFRRAGYLAHGLALPLYFYRKHEGSMSTNPERKKVAEFLSQKYH